MRLLPLLFWLLAPCSLLQAAAGAPNIIILFIDDLGYGDQPALCPQSRALITTSASTSQQP